MTLEQKNDKNKNRFVTAEVVINPENKNFKILEGDESIFPETVKNYRPESGILGRVAKGLMDLIFVCWK